MTSILAVSPSNRYDEYEMKYLLESSKNLGFSIEIIGLDRPFTFMSKITWLQEYLFTLPKEENPIICFTDAYDVFYSDTLETIRDKFLSFNCGIVWSVERAYSHQLKTDMSFYDNLDTSSKSPYKYINTGTFMGYKNDLLQLMNDIIESTKDISFINDLAQEGWTLSSTSVDQTIISHHLAQNWHKYTIILDRACQIFYIPCLDWTDIESYINKEGVLTVTGAKPSIIHVSFKMKYEYLLVNLFNIRFGHTFQNKLLNKTYTWYGRTIQFLDNNTFAGFTDGTYKFIDDMLVLVHFDKKEYVFHLEEDLKMFISYSKTYDGEILYATLVE